MPEVRGNNLREERRAAMAFNVIEVRWRRPAWREYRRRR
jgi:hypothetical protein